MDEEFRFIIDSETVLGTVWIKYKDGIINAAVEQGALKEFDEVVDNLDEGIHHY